MEFEVGSVYKLDHNTRLPRYTTIPASLNSIKAVMVNNKSDDEVTVVFPSLESVRNFFGNKKVSGLMQPNLDEHFVMNLNVGKKLLASKVPFEEFASQRGNRNFWVVDDHHLHDSDHDDHDDEDDDGDGDGDRRVSANLNGGLGLSWRKRRRTMVYGKQRISSSFDERRNKMSIVPCVEKEEDEDEVEEEKKEEKKIPEKTRILRKRKCHLKGVKYRETKKKNKKKMIKGVSEKKFKDSQHRWTVERYKLAEKNMLKILKEKEAGPSNPILRPDLRTEARKLIGDTGLLDHLLKHMAGKVAPGGKERFRRRHNPEGAMEYWIESADLIETRKQAGVTDPYWVPPPGWKPGDCPNQDPVCATQLRELKGEVADMKRELEKLASRGKESNEASIELLKGWHHELMKKKADIEKQLLEISKTFSGMEEDIEWLKQPVVDEEETQGEHDRQLVLGIMAEENNQKAAAINESDDHHDQISQDKEKMIIMLQQQQPSSEEEKEKRRQNLKSGFRICKPQGTFLWPSQMPSSSVSSPNQQVVVHLDDLLEYPTPPSVTSSSCSKPPIFPPPPPPHNHQLPPSPRVKRPVATRAAVTLNVSVATIRGSTTIDTISSPPSTATATTGFSSVHNSFVPDLNEVPLTTLA